MALNFDSELIKTHRGHNILRCVYSSDTVVSKQRYSTFYSYRTSPRCLITSEAVDWLVKASGDGT